MIEIEFSTIHNDENDLASIRALLDEFQATHTNIRVRLTKMLRGTAWPELMNISSAGRGPDVSHVGSTWISSLVGMNALRPFRPNEVALVGNEHTFIPSAWQDTRLVGDNTIWAMPWNSFLYVIFYRKDLLARAGIDSSSAFGDLHNLSHTIERLRETGLESPWLIPYGPPPYEGLLHQAASWVWSAGGDFVNETGTQIILNKPEGVHGLTHWLESQRAVPEVYRNLNDTECIEMLTQGKAGAIVSHIRAASILINGISGTEALEQIGFTTMTNVPWCAGDNIVIWLHTQGYPERQRAALELVQFLISPHAQVRLAQEAHMMPTRRDALLEAYPEGHPLHAVASQAAASGKAYLSMRLWRRIENQIAQTIGPMLQDAYENPSETSEAIVQKHIFPVVERLNLVLGN